MVVIFVSKVRDREVIYGERERESGGGKGVEKRERGKRCVKAHLCPSRYNHFENKTTFV